MVRTPGRCYTCKKELKSEEQGGAFHVFVLLAGGTDDPASHRMSSGQIIQQNGPTRVNVYYMFVLIWPCCSNLASEDKYVDSRTEWLPGLSRIRLDQVPRVCLHCLITSEQQI